MTTATRPGPPMRGGGPVEAGPSSSWATRRNRAPAALAALVVLCGIIVLIGGPVRTVLQQRAAERKATAVATDATCFRLSSLEAGVASGSLGPEEIRGRVSDMAIGATAARSSVAEAARDLADVFSAEAGADPSWTGVAAWAVLADACRSS